MVKNLRIELGYREGFCVLQAFYWYALLFQWWFPTPKLLSPQMGRPFLSYGKVRQANFLKVLSFFWMRVVYSQLQISVFILKKWGSHQGVPIDRLNLDRINWFLQTSV